MRTILWFQKMMLALCALFMVIGCSEEDSSLITEESKYPEGSMEYHFFVELGLKPSEIDSINFIRLFKEYDDCYLLGGQRNHHIWLSKLDKNGDEIFAYEQHRLDNWKYSYIHNNSILYQKDNLLFLQEFYTDVENIFDQIMFVNDEYLSIFNFSTGKEIDSIGPFADNGMGVRFNINESNGRYLIVPYDYDYGKEYDFYVLNKNGRIIYNREWTEKESSTFRNGIIFIDVEIVAPVWNEDNSPSKSYPIVNLKTWEIVHEFNRDSGLIFRGDYANEPDIFYDVDTTYLKGNAIKFVYSENKRDYDEISGISNYTTIHKYAYSIDTNTYDIVFEGKIE